MLEKLIKTDSGAAALVLRITLAVVIFPHGAQKLFGWFGGNGFTATLTFFENTFGFPAFVTVLVMLAESVGAVLLALGFLTRFTAAAIGLVMAGAVTLVHAQNGFFMNWYGSKQGEGFEFHLLAIGIVLALLITGGGFLSIDGAIYQHLKKRRF
ncbi:MAG: DoxX family protein [Hymenobacteraceae bacterium]|nr:DoxX family protein [Hymenobacteraceae bacterium]MDX5396360.1 DoxX family protein [Hymenobacteraceae bacterium]MDX5443937.1 DoxX family protein [Hymenobacteraceae bacterium]MDX5512422.1 DoxX family protein [Hymenobacteraceae bacterium]